MGKHMTYLVEVTKLIMYELMEVITHTIHFRQSVIGLHSALIFYIDNVLLPPALVVGRCSSAPMFLADSDLLRAAARLSVYIQ